MAPSPSCHAEERGAEDWCMLLLHRGPNSRMYRTLTVNRFKYTLLYSPLPYPTPPYPIPLCSSLLYPTAPLYPTLLPTLLYPTPLCPSLIYSTLL